MLRDEEERRVHPADDHWCAVIPEPVEKIVASVRGWKERLTENLGPRDMLPEISMFDESGEFLGDMDFTIVPTHMDWMGVGLALSGLVMAFDVRYFAFTTEAYLTKSDVETELRDDGTIKAPSLGLIHQALHPDDKPLEDAWLEGSESVTKSIVVAVADTTLGRTWNYTMPFRHALGNKVNWLAEPTHDEDGPDYRSPIWGAFLVPSIIRSQYDYVKIRPEPQEALEFLFLQGLTLTVMDGTTFSEALKDTQNVSVTSYADIERSGNLAEEAIAEEVSELDDVPDWLIGDDNGTA